MTREQQAQAVRKLTVSGMGDYTIAAATRLSVEVIRENLSDAHRPSMIPSLGGAHAGATFFTPTAEGKQTP